MFLRSVFAFALSGVGSGSTCPGTKALGAHHSTFYSAI